MKNQPNQVSALTDPVKKVRRIRHNVILNFPNGMVAIMLPASIGSQSTILGLGQTLREAAENVLASKAIVQEMRGKDE